MKYAHINFPAGTVTVELVDSPLVDLWEDVIDQYNNFDAELMVSKGPLFHLGGEYRKDRILSAEQKAVDEINEAVERLNNSLGNVKFPYQAYMNMPWEQTNYIHRAFTTGMSSYHTFVHNLAKADLIEYQKFKYNEPHKLKFISEPVFKTPVEEGLLNYVEVMNTINKYVHHFEDVRFSANAHKMLNHFFKFLNHPEEIQMNWDVYNTKTGVKSLFIKHNPTYQEVMQSAKTNLDEYDVYFVKSILGKDYETCFVNFDNPLEYDIQNIQDITGGVRILLDGAQKYLFKDSPFTQWADSYNIRREHYLPIPLGKIVDSDFNLKSIKNDPNLPPNSDGSEGPELKYRNPKITIVEVND